MNSSTTEIGNVSEMYVLNLLLSFDTVQWAERDFNNSKYDIFFRIKSDSFLRGLQVKTMGVNGQNSFCIQRLDKYTDGTLIVCVRPQQYGIVCVMSDLYRRVTARATIGGTKGAFSKILQPWNDFVIKLKNMLASAQIIYDIRSTMTEDNVKSYESTQRFILFCKSHNLDYKVVGDASHVTDIIVNDKKIQLKYSSEPEHPKYSYQIHLGRKNNIPYKEGDNDYYIIELGGFHEEFLILPEQQLINRGYISSNGNIGKTTLYVFHETYVECGKLTNSKPGNVKGNWMCNSNLWYDDNRRPDVLINNIQPPNNIAPIHKIKTIIEYLHRRISGMTLLSIKWDNQSQIIPSLCAACGCTKGWDLRSPTQQSNLQTYIKHSPYQVTAVTSHGNNIFFHLQSLRDNYQMYIHSQLDMIANGLLNPKTITNLSLQFGEAVLLLQHYLAITESTFYFDDKRQFSKFDLLTSESYQSVLSKLSPNLLSGNVT